MITIKTSASVDTFADACNRFRGALLSIAGTLAAGARTGTAEVKALGAAMRRRSRALHMRRRRTHPGAWSDSTRERRARRLRKAQAARDAEFQRRAMQRLRGFATGGIILRNRADRRRVERDMLEWRAAEAGIAPLLGEPTRALSKRVRERVLMVPSCAPDADDAYRTAEDS